MKKYIATVLTVMSLSLSAQYSKNVFDSEVDTNANTTVTEQTDGLGPGNPGPVPVSDYIPFLFAAGIMLSGYAAYRMKTVREAE